MKIILSPAKKMNRNTDTLPYQDLPVFLAEAEQIMSWMRTLTFAEAQTLWGCNDKLAELNYDRFQKMNLRSGLTPAILSYEGIQYQYMAPMVFEEAMLDYVQEHLRILSGFYGVLRPMDGVTPYRLEMQAKAAVGGCRNLYDFWDSKIYEQVVCGEAVLNLASKEYSRCVERFLAPEDIFITCVFGELSGGKVLQKGTYAKMARGEMVRFLAEHHVLRPEGAQEFARLGYTFCPERSTEHTYIFLKS